MSGIFEKLVFYFQYPFVWYALIVGVLIALCSSLLGVTLVLKRFSFIGDGLSHVAFGAMAIASVLNFSNNMLFVMPVTVICAVLLLRTGQSTKIKGDAAIAMISVGALAVGYLLMNVFSTGSNISGDVCSSLFGSTSILTLTTAEVWLCVVVSVIVVALFTVFYHKIFAVTFDENFAKATGTRTDMYNLLIAVITAVIIVLAMNLVDLNLPGTDGLEILRQFREHNTNTPVLILSARDQIEDKVNGLDLGANDYLTKPFHFQELEARIRSLTRRKFVQEDVCLKWNQLTFDTRTREASVNGVPLSLTRKESSLLEYFLLHQNRVISPEEMIEHIWDGSVNTFSNSIRVHISSLRKKLKAAIGFDPIQNKIGQGYILEEYR